MSDTYNYSLVKNDEGNFVVRSTVKSFNLDHVTDKDVISFYSNFSEYASFDTGLLPLDGTGVLAIRTSGPHTQIVTQHAPGLYHVNWGSFEGDKTAKAYYVAQPYRVVIGDFENGNLLGARMFYSPYPITNPSQILYHVNLPNINCKGYRGNGVGWICLYHKDDWSNLPFNEKVSRFIERCSGVETYNDANMSETDGPRFYESRGFPQHITNPAAWQEKSEKDGYLWTLDPSAWIPVKVTGIDSQDCHNDNGEHLTLAMAMLGNYRAYYTDNNVPKMYNIVSRSDLSFTNNHIADIIKKAFASAPVVYKHKAKDDPYSFTLQHREKNGSAQLTIPINNTDEDAMWVCYSCDQTYSESDDNYTVVSTSGNEETVCEGCFNEYYIYISSADAHYNYDDSSIVYVEYESEYFHDQYDTIISCPDCSNMYAASGQNQNSYNKVYSKMHLVQDEQYICSDCFNTMITDDELSSTSCFACTKTVINSTGWNSVYPTVKALLPQEDGTMSVGYVTFCNNCSSDHLVCPCGYIKSSKEETANCTPTQIDSGNDSITLTVTKCCTDCLGPVEFVEDNAVAHFVPKDKETLNKLVSENYYHTVPYIQVSIKDDKFF